MMLILLQLFNQVVVIRGIFSPCKKIGKLQLIDGGIQENIPWQELKNVGADKVLSVIFLNKENEKCCNNVFEVLSKSFDILCHELNKHEGEGSDYKVKIKHDSKGLLNIKSLKKLYRMGYDETKKFIKENKCLTKC